MVWDDGPFGKGLTKVPENSLACPVSKPFSEGPFTHPLN